MTPLLIIIPFWAEDQPRVIPLAKVLVGLEPHSVQDAHVLLAPRQDCQLNPEIEAILRQRFNVSIHHCTSPARGYPMATNGMFFSVYNYLRSQAHRYDTTLWLEADMLPINRYWRAALVKAWTKRRPNCFAMGHIFPVAGEGTDHLNGGALWSPRILEVIPDICTCSGAWDWANRHKILPWAEATETIHYWHHARNVTTYPRDSRTVVIHGVKDDSLVKLVAADFGINV